MPITFCPANRRWDPGRSAKPKMCTTTRWARACALGALLLGATACGADQSELAVPAPSVVVSVIALDNNFRPQAVTAKVGDTIEFTNRGKNDHDILPASGREWGVLIEGFRPRDVYSYVFTKPGVYAYYCSIHGTNRAGMVGTITVTE
jgi:plastocyanin